MRIVYVTTEYPALTANYGGIAVVYKNEVESLRLRGHDVEVILISSYLLKDAKIPPYVSLFHFPVTGKLKGLRGRIKLTFYINSRYDRNTIIVNADFGGLLPFRIKSKKIVQLHGSGTLKLFLQWKNAKMLLYLLEYKNIKNSDKIRAVSQAVLNESKNVFPLIKKIPAEIIHNGIHGFNETRIEHMKSPQITMNVIFIGKLSELKGVLFLGAIINGIHEVLPEMEFIIIGHDEIKGGQSRREELIKSIRLIQRVSLYERVDNNEMGQFLNKSNVLILPSKTEALPMVVIEAFSCHVPVVAFNVGGLSELIDDGINGYLIQPFDINTFVHKVIAILSEETETIRMPEKAYLKFVSEFRLETCINKLEAFYSQK